MYVMFSLSIIFGMFIIGSQRSYGEKNINDEKFMVIVSSIVMSMGIWRFTWSLLMKNFGFKKTYGMLLCI